eukprot:gb/GFBE01036561.1/.p1 GENE.gb/GFBE01036561.1/~~gb/GFBE01036561.1/.p1  ORF type:complete len:481 (+),score=104.09 gb/GFBE01036561.1/:1-1443(+)
MNRQDSSPRQVYELECAKDDAIHGDGDMQSADDAAGVVQSDSPGETNGETTGGAEKLLKLHTPKVNSRKHQEEHQSETCSRKVMNRLVDTIAPMVIVLNTITMGVSCDLCEGCAVWDIIEAVFTTFYLVEFLVKLKLYGCRGYFAGDGFAWNLFDFFILTVSLIETTLLFATTFIFADSNSASAVTDLVLLKVLRLLRLMRTIRALNFEAFKELKLMLMGIVNGLVVLGWAIVLLFVLIWVLSILLRSMVGDKVSEFSSMPSSMFTLFRCFTDGCSAYNGTPLSETLRQDLGSWDLLYIFGYVMVMMLVMLGIFNMVMAMFLETAMSAAVRRKQRELSERAPETCSEFKRIIAQLLVCEGASMAKNLPVRTNSFGVGARLNDKDLVGEEVYNALVLEDRSVSRSQFMSWLELPVFVNALENADIDTSTMNEMFDTLDADMGGNLELDELVTGLMKLRGPISKNDIIATRLKVRELVARRS